MTTIGLIGSGSMGSALGAGWLESGAHVLTATGGRSDRTRELARAAGIEAVESLDDVVGAGVLLVCVVPPGAVLEVGRDIARAARRTGTRPLVLDLNAVAPSTMAALAALLAEAGCDVVDGSISGGPPASGATVRVYLSGPRAAEIAPNSRADVVVLDDVVGTASALKMCTASMYKGTTALVMQALLAADHYGVRDAFLADTARRWPHDVPTWHRDVAVGAAKAWRFVPEMREIARAQADAGLPAELFEGVAAAWARAADTDLGHLSPEDVDTSVAIEDVVSRLRP